MMKRLRVRTMGPVLAFLALQASSLAWEYEGHRLINQLALATLPTNFPAFVRTPEAEARVAFLSGEPDRWRNTTNLPLKHLNSPDHFIDLEDLAPYRLKRSMLSHFRYEFTAQLALARAANPAAFPTINPTNDLDRTKALVGFLPWTIHEYYAKLKSAFSYWKAFDEAGTPEEIANAAQNVTYLMGVMGHFVGDATQPLHTTRNFNGWVDRNPRGYTTNKSFHGWIDGGYFQKTGLFRVVELRSGLRQARVPEEFREHPDDIFPQVMNYIIEQHKQVEPLYQLEKEGKLSGDGERGLLGRDFLAGQLIQAAQMLGDLWYAAWEQAPPDAYVRTELLKRKAGTN